jgi:hypothetical protein
MERRDLAGDRGGNALRGEVVVEDLSLRLAEDGLGAGQRHHGSHPAPRQRVEEEMGRLAQRRLA